LAKSKILTRFANVYNKLYKNQVGTDGAKACPGQLSGTR